MDDSLFQLYVEKIVLNTYSNTSRTIEQYYRTGQILKGPFLLKVDSGTGRLSKSKDNFDFRRRIWERGVVIIIGIPNSKETTQEMDDTFQTFLL